MNDLYSYTTDELIKELTSRTTFVGVLIYSHKESRQLDERHTDWQITVNNLEPEQVLGLFEQVRLSLESDIDS